MSEPVRIEIEVDGQRLDLEVISDPVAVAAWGRDALACGSAALKAGAKGREVSAQRIDRKGKIRLIQRAFVSTPWMFRRSVIAVLDRFVHGAPLPHSPA